MSLSLPTLEEFLGAQQKAVLVEILRAAGSTPREMGAFMLVSAKNMTGTIGGGQVEYMALDKARQMLRGNDDEEHRLDIALGPLIGQCCGGHVTLGLRRVNAVVAQKLRQRMALQVAQYPYIYIMGAGHVGRSLARALAPLPFKTIVVDTRKDTLSGLPENIEMRHCVLPEAEVRSAPAGSAFVILTHDHALDFLIASEALARADLSYVGMIGSKSKRAIFASWLRDEGHGAQYIEPLICPIGGDKVKDKRPEVIAALVVAQILVHTQQKQSEMAIKTNKAVGANNGGEKTGVK